MPKLSQRQIEMSQSLRAGMQPGAPYPKAKLKPETEPNVETKSGRRPLCTFIVAKQSKGQRQVLLYDFVLPKRKRHFIGFNLHARSRAMSERSNPSHISSPLAFDTCLRPQAMQHEIGLIFPAQELPYTHVDSLQKHQSLTFHLTGVCVNAETEISTSEMSSS